MIIPRVDDEGQVKARVGCQMPVGSISRGQSRRVTSAFELQTCPDQMKKRNQGLSRRVFYVIDHELTCTVGMPVPMT